MIDDELYDYNAEQGFYSNNDWMKNEPEIDFNSDENVNFSCIHCNQIFDEPNLLILHISTEHNDIENVKKSKKGRKAKKDAKKPKIRKEKNPKMPCVECGKLYSDSGLRGHMIRVSKLLTVN